jgi:pimeloyl-ACP methyl ester carboxylesterase
MAEFLLVHGAWHGGWCFDRLADELRARGHTVDAPDLPSDRIGLDQHDYARLLGPRPDAIAVGHSLGAQTVALLQARRRVYLGGVLPVENVYAESFAEGFGGFVRDDLGRSYWPDLETAMTRLYPDCTPVDAAGAFARLRTQAPFDAIAAPLDGAVVVATLRDAAIDGAWQVRTGKAHGAEVHELDAGHFPMLTHPAELAELLVSLS